MSDLFSTESEVVKTYTANDEHPISIRVLGGVYWVDFLEYRSEESPEKCRTKEYPEKCRSEDKPTNVAVKIIQKMSQ